MSTFRTKFHMSIWDGSEFEADLVIKFEVKRGMPETGAGYLADPAGYDPGSPDEIDIVSVQLFRNGTELFVPKWIDTLIRSDEELLASLSAEAKEAA